MNKVQIEIVKDLAVQEGLAIMDFYATDFSVELKADHSPLTLADQKANEVIVKGLQEHFPEYAILSEESRDDKSRLLNEFCFIVDPLDGTKEFVKRNGQFTVNIALSCNKKTIMGVIYVPVTQELYYASCGAGAFQENVETGEFKRLGVTDKLKELVVVGSKSHSSEKEQKLNADHQDLISETISAGSSLKGCMVASGKADVYYRFGLTSEWDTAAMHCIVEEAGGIFRQMDGSVMLYNREQNLNEKGFYVVNRPKNIWV